MGLLRAAPAASLLSYYLGALPFALGVLWFWTSLSHGADAAQRLPATALGLALLHVWLKTWQAVFARQLHASLCGESAAWPTPAGVLRLAATQSIVQPLSLFLLPLALGTVVLFPHTCAFFQSATALAARPDLGTRALVRHAAQEAFRWPWQNIQALLVLVLFGVFVCFNMVCASFLLPFLLKTLLGIESAFTRSSAALLNTTSLIAILLLTWLCLDPILKAFYVLRCFHGDSLRSGQDLRASLRRLAAAGAAALLLLAGTTPTHGGEVLAGPVNDAPAVGSALLGRAPLAGHLNRLAGVAAVPGGAAPAEGSGLNVAQTAPASTGQSVPAEELDRAIAETLNRPEYDWRTARERVESERGWLRTRLEDFIATVRDWVDRLLEWLGELLQKLFRRDRAGGGFAGISVTRLLLILLVAVLAAVVAVALVRALRSWHSPVELTAQPVPAVPDLEAQDVHAGQLPADGWSRLAAELLERGEYRLALRALFLASLALLAERGLLTLARFKSNRDYERELDRRAHALPGLAAQFAGNVQLVDRVWYGQHGISRADAERFAQGVEEMRGKV
jgi:hypothetical protein